MVAFHEREKKYRRDFYLRRKEPEETFAAFIHGAERLCIFVVIPDAEKRICSAI